MDSFMLRKSKTKQNKTMKNVITKILWSIYTLVVCAVLFTLFANGQFMHGAYIFTIAVLIAVIAALVTLYNEQGAKIERLQRLLDERERIIKSNSNSNSNSNTVIAARPNNVYGNETQYHIRKLTPVETGRLMGLRDNEIQKMLDCGLSNSAMYKLYGNSIVVDVLYHVFRTMFISNQSENNTINLFNYDTKN
jgi:uncharacterized protein YxeA